MHMAGIDLESLIFIGLAFAIGGVLKGATGAGAPIVAVPVLAIFYDVQTAVALFVMPNIVSNLIQFVQYRHANEQPGFTLKFALAGALGAAFGTFLLAFMSSRFLVLAVGLVIFAYIAFRLFRPDWKLDQPLAEKLVGPFGGLAGILQGAAGISAPVSVTFLNAMRMDRTQFIVTISVFFLAMGLVQLPLQVWFQIMNVERFIQSCIALLPLTLFLPVGAAIGKTLSPALFDKMVLVILAILGCKMLFDSLLA